ncbi:AraC family transcriptional regulator [Paenibacillus profundus]|uniref:AraC family transcriptional regulator n=1 Tax=Paenibacillus profundus TaxID=1173085 RepID=A0ABS8YQW7_9BACL|nr:AraC family transcriptional regulator [Paenibacillus profundus]MCE5172740.1 AraC family transcriptional regulator [Paenibacillus profundus]
MDLEILRCKYTGKLKQMYLEAKVLEMIVVCLHELESVKSGPLPRHGRESDLESLQRAKAILDNNIAAPPTLSLLAQCVHMNEHKLKQGFKQLFGMPVYAYVLDRRMTKAKYLLEMEQLRVGEVAEHIGYSSNQHFTRAFYKKFVCNPSDCLKRRDVVELQ